MAAGPAAGTGATGLAGVIALEIADTPAAAFAGVLLADFGAQVLACEQPGTGSALRHLGPAPPAWWRALARNKRSLALDAEGCAARGVLARLLASADIVITDGLPPAWHAALETLPRKPLLIVLHPTGADDPEGWGWSTGADLTAAATGMMALTGWRDGPPVQPEVPLAECLAGTFGALRAVAELRRARLGRPGPDQVPIALHEAAQRMIDWQLPVASALGRPELRDGNSFPMNAGISNMHRTRDGKYVAISAATQAVAARLLAMVGGAALRDDPRMGTPQQRAAHMPEIYALIDDWVGARTLADAMAEADRADVVLGPIFTTKDILADSHLAARANLVEVGGMTMPGVVPRFAGTDRTVRHAGPDLGADSVAALGAAGFDAAEIHALVAEKLVAVAARHNDNNG